MYSYTDSNQQLLMLYMHVSVCCQLIVYNNSRKVYKDPVYKYWTAGTPMHYFPAHCLPFVHKFAKISLTALAQQATTLTGSKLSTL